MRKLFSFVIVFIVFFNLRICCGAEVIVSTAAQLMTAVDPNQDTPIHLNAASFVLTADLNVNYACEMDIVYDGNVVIDGNDLYKTTAEDCTATFTGTDGKRIIFTQGDDSTLVVRATSAATTITFNYCDFTEASTLYGLGLMDTPAAEMIVTCNNCRAFNNYNDGFSIKGVDAASQHMTLNLNDCESFNNAGNGNAQGVTAHYAWQHLNINGGSYYGNDTSGIAVQGGARGYIKDANVYDNTGHQIVVATSGTYAAIINCYIHGMLTVTYGISHNAGVCFILNNRIEGSGAASEQGIFIQGDSCIVEGNYIYGMSAAISYAIKIASTAKGAVIRNNTIYDVYQAFALPSVGVTVQNNIIHTTVSYMAITGLGGGCFGDSTYKRHKDNGYNCFYNCAGLFFDSVDGTKDQSQATDIISDPLLVDVSNKDFRLKPGSPCLNTGKPTLGIGWTSRGAWQKKQGASR